jgi:kynureninase
MGQGLIRSWNSAGWFDLPQRLGDKIAPLVGAGPGEVVATDSTSVNLYKVLSAALNIAAQDAPQRRVIVSERSNFPTDLYIAEALCKERGCSCSWWSRRDCRRADARRGGADADPCELPHRRHARHGRGHDRRPRRRRAGGVGPGAQRRRRAGGPARRRGRLRRGLRLQVPQRRPRRARLRVGHPRHADRFWQPLAGWWGHAAPFEFTPDYRPAPGITRYLCGTQPILAMTALDCGLDTCWPPSRWAAWRRCAPSRWR